MDTENFSEFVSIQLSRTSSIPPRVQLADVLMHRIREGRLPEGAPLPPVRKLAALLSLNPGTVSAAYHELESRGLILSRRGSGSFVASRAEPALLSMPLTEEAPLPGVTDMSRIAVDPALFQGETIKRFMSRIIDRDGPSAFLAGESQGYLPLRRALSEMLAEEGIAAPASRIQIVSGSQQGIDIASRTLLSRGSFVITEDPTYPDAVSVFRACGAKTASLPLSRGGLDIAALETLILRYRPSLLYLTPDIQVPTGITYNAQVKARILALARRYEFYILEDDYANGLWYGSAPRPMKAIDTHDRVLYLRSLSSLFAAGLRLAFLVMPEALAPSLRRVKYLSDISSAGLAQKILDLYLREKEWLPYVRCVREASEEKMKWAMAAAARSLPAGTDIERPAGGLSLWITLPEGVSAREVLAASLEEGFRFGDGAPFCLTRPARECLRISFGAAGRRDIENAFRVLGDILSKKA